MSEYSLIGVVRAEFEKSKNKLADEALCKQATKSLLDRKSFTRAFDPFPSLISEDILAGFGKEFESLINRIILFNLSNDELQLEPEISEKFQDYLNQIIILGRKQLLDNGKVNADIICEYGWEPYQNQFHVGDLICAFVGKVFQSIVKVPAIDQLIKTDNTTALSSAFDFINKNYGLLVAKDLEKFGIKYTPSKQRSILQVLRDAPKKHPVAAATTFGVLAAGVGALVVTFFAVASNGNNAPSTFKGPSNTKRSP